MRDYVHEHFAAHPNVYVRPAIKCKDGAIYSVQASEGHYCSPRETGLSEYSTVEVWRCDKTTRKEPEGWVPVRNVNRRIADHGGIA